MNIMFLHFSGPASVIPKVVSSRIANSKAHIIADEMTSHLQSFENVMFTRDCSLGDFLDIQNYQDIPLDAEFLKEMSSCESMTLKMMDRYQHSRRLVFYEERINLYHKQLSYWLNYLSKENIKICVFQTIPHVIHDYIIYCLCKKLGIQTIMFHRTPVMLNQNVSLYSLEDIDSHISDLGQSYQSYFRDGKDFVLGNEILSYLQLTNGNDGKTFSGIVMKNAISKKYLIPSNYINFFQYKRDQFKAWFLLWGNPVDLLLKFLFKKFAKKTNIDKVHQSINLKLPFIFVSLHYQPECSTSPMGGFFVHQDLMLDILMRSIPENIKIYVKAHPRDGYSKSFTERVRYDERTFFLDPNMNSFDLIKNSIAVATVTGTAGWEGFLNKKPILMFGDYFYKDAPSVYRVNNVLNCKDAFQQIQAGKSEISDEMINSFLKALEDNTFSGWVDNRYAENSFLSQTENFNNLADIISKKINSEVMNSSQNMDQS